MERYDEIRGLLNRVRRRWRALRAFQATVRIALSATLVVAVAMIAARWTDGAPVALAVVAILGLALIIGAVVWSLLPLREVPDDRKVARFVEERDRSLEDRLISAVDVAANPMAAGGLAEPMLADAARRLRDVDIETILSSEAIRRAGFQAAAAALVLAVVVISSRHTIRQAADAAALTLFPSRVTLDVVPGNARIKAGSALAIQARLVGNKAPVTAQVQVAAGDSWRPADMTTDRPGEFRLGLDAVVASFKYRVVAGAVTSPVFEITVVRPPRVARIDVDYSYPEGLNLKPRTERDSGDIYAPAGTDVRLHVITDQPAANGRMALATGKAVDLTASGPNELSATLKVTADDSYRLALADREGLSSDGDIEYFIRMLEDRPPDVRVLKPASDRSVTRLEEVDIDAQAEDDYGVDRLDLVYQSGESKRKPFRSKFPGARQPLPAITRCFLKTWIFSRAISSRTTSVHAT